MKKLRFVYLEQAGKRNFFTSFSHNLGPTFQRFPVHALQGSFQTLGSSSERRGSRQSAFFPADLSSLRGAEDGGLVWNTDPRKGKLETEFASAPRPLLCWTRAQCPKSDPEVMKIRVTVIMECVNICIIVN